MKSTNLPSLVTEFGTGPISLILNWSYHRTYYYKRKAENPSFHPLKNGGKRTGMDFFQRKIVHHAVLFYLDKEAVTTLKDIREVVLRATGISRSVSWYCRFLSSINFSWKTVEVKESNKYTSLNLDR